MKIKFNYSFFLIGLIFSLLLTCNIKVFAAPAAPNGLIQKYESANWVKIEWNNVSNAKAYYVEYSLDKQNWIMEDSIPEQVYGNKTEYEIEKLQEATTYYVRVRALEGAFPTNYDSKNTQAQGGLSAASNILEIVTAPRKIVNLVQSAAAGNSVTIKWDAVKGATHYRVFEEIREESVCTCCGYSYHLLAVVQTPSAVIENRTLSEKATFIVCPIKKASHGYEAGNEQTSLTVYSVPQKVGKLFVDWSDVNADSIAKYRYCVGWNDIKASSYEVEYYSANDKKVYVDMVEEFSCSEITLPAEVRNKAFKFRVRACQKISNGDSIYGEWSDFKTVIPYGQITKGKALGKGRARLTWKKIENASHYYVYIANKSNGKYKKIATTKKNSYIFKNLKTKKNYYVFITAKVKVGKKNYRTNLGQMCHDYYGFRLKK